MNEDFFNNPIDEDFSAQPQEIEYEEIIEFQVSDDWESILYSQTKNEWRVWCIWNGDELEEPINNIKTKDCLVFPSGLTVGKEDIQSFISIVESSIP